MFEAGCTSLVRETDGTKFRLIGIGAAPLVAAVIADKGNLAEPNIAGGLARQTAIDQLRARFGATAVQCGRSLPKSPARK